VGKKTKKVVPPSRRGGERSERITSSSGRVNKVKNFKKKKGISRFGATEKRKYTIVEEETYDSIRSLARAKVWTWMDKVKKQISSVKAFTRGDNLSRPCELQEKGKKAKKRDIPKIELSPQEIGGKESRSLERNNKGVTVKGETRGRIYLSAKLVKVLVREKKASRIVKHGEMKGGRETKESLFLTQVRGLYASSTLPRKRRRGPKPLCREHQFKPRRQKMWSYQWMMKKRREIFMPLRKARE